MGLVVPPFQYPPWNGTLNNSFGAFSYLCPVKNQLAIFASGSGTNAEAILNHFKGHSLVSVSLVITNKADAGVIQVAERHGVPVKVISKVQLNDEAFLLGLLKQYNVTWVILAGFLMMIPPFLVHHFQNRMINIHPALLPKFGGKGMYGRHVHEAVLKAGERKSGITIHYVTEEYDEGKIIHQAELSVSPAETIESLEKKIHELEHKNYPVIIEKLISV